MKGFQKGNTHGRGRPKGSQNKDVKELRQRISDLIDRNFDQIQNDLQELTPKERIDVLIKLFEYSLPKLSRTELTADTKGLHIDMRPIFELSDSVGFE